MVNTELRIGNWISMCKDPIKYNDFHQVTNLSDDEIGIHNGAIKVEEYYPIPITPEILSKAGFQFDGDWNYKNGNLVLHDMSDTDIKCFEVYWQYPKDVMVVGNFLTIRHLHQLQNLYFALTGEELAINL